MNRVANLLLMSLVATATTAQAGPASELVERLEVAVPGLLGSGNIPGLSIAILENGETEWSQVFGVRNLETNEPVDPKTVFEAASLSKPVFAYAVMRLVDRNEFDLDRPLAQILPNERMAHDERYRNITGRLVLSHSSGLPNWGGERLDLNFEPGTNFNYSGEGYVYLQQALESVTNLSLDELAQREVFSPLGMENSAFVWRDDFERLAGARHDRGGNVSPLNRESEGNAAASLLTTADDYARFLVAMCQGTGLKPATRRMMLSEQTSLRNAGWGSDEEVKAKLSWGLGWGLQPTGDSRTFWHWGDNGTAKAFAMTDVESGRGFVYFANSRDGLSIVGALSELVFDEPALALSFLNYEQHDDPGRLARLRMASAFAESLEAGRSAYRELARTLPEGEAAEQLGRLAEALLSSGDTARGLGALRLAVADQKETWRSHARLAEALHMHGDYADAVASFRKAITVASDDAVDELQRRLEWIQVRLSAQRSPVSVPQATLERYAGTYGPRRVVLDDGRLFYQRGDNPRYPLVALATNLFALEGLETFRLRFVESDDGYVDRVVGLYFEGNEDESPRDPSSQRSR